MVGIQGQHNNNTFYISSHSVSFSSPSPFPTQTEGGKRGGPRLTTGPYSWHRGGQNDAINFTHMHTNICIFHLCMIKLFDNYVINNT